MADELKRAQQKLRALRTAERNLAKRMSDIDWRMDVLEPELKSLAALAAVGELPSFELAGGDPVASALPAKSKKRK